MSGFAADLSAFAEMSSQPAKKKAKRPAPSTTESSSATSSSAGADAGAKYIPAVVTKIYIACPSKITTGGPEALHALCHKITACSSSSIVCEMLYFDAGAPGKRFVHVVDGRASVYDMYGTVSATSPPSLPSDLVIWPEFYTDRIDTFSASQKCIWWLSVDNNNNLYTTWSRADVLHLAQSKYALEFLKSKAVSPSRAWMLTEYIHQTRHPVDVSFVSRNDVILYNPFKGMHYSDALIERGKSTLTFTPIGGSGDKRLTPAQVTELLKSSKVYIDFGNHPGMDRLPREAALAGCIVVTNKQGAAGYTSDVPIGDQYKFNKFDEDKIHNKLKECLDNFEDKCKDFDAYRTWIKTQEMVMDCVVERILHRLSNVNWEKEEDAMEVETLMVRVRQLEEEVKGLRSKANE
jgi:hypothetical protein